MYITQLFSPEKYTSCILNTLLYCMHGLTFDAECYINVCKVQTRVIQKLLQI